MAPETSPYLFEGEDHARLREVTRRFARAEIEPHAHAWDEAGAFPRSLYSKVAAAGLLGLSYPEELGGAGGDVTHAMVSAEEMVLAGKNVGVVAGLGSHAIALPPILHHGTDEQRRRWVPPVLRGEQVACLAITEPGAGSDVARITTRATRDGDHYVVVGQKTFITSGTRADFAVCAVRTGGEGHGGISLLVIEADRPGFGVARSLDKMGWWASDTAELFFDGVRVPAANLLGEENGGFAAIMTNFVTERVLLAAQCVAIAELAFREAVAYARERQAFGKALTGFQVTRHKLAEMSTRIAAARALTGEVAVRLREGSHDAARAAKAKNVASDACTAVVDQAVQIHGGAGFMRGVTVERLYRDARLYPIGGGTREIMNELIAKVEGY